MTNLISTKHQLETQHIMKCDLQRIRDLDGELATSADVVSVTTLRHRSVFPGALWIPQSARIQMNCSERTISSNHAEFASAVHGVVSLALFAFEARAAYIQRSGREGNFVRATNPVRQRQRGRLPCGQLCCQP